MEVVSRWSFRRVCASYLCVSEQDHAGNLVADAGVEVADGGRCEGGSLAVEVLVSE